MPREIFGYAGETSAQKAARERQENRMLVQQQQQREAQNQARMIQQQRDQQKALEAQRMANIAGATLLKSRNVQGTGRARDLIEQRLEQKAADQFAAAKALEKEYKESPNVWVPKGPSGNIFEPVEPVKPVEPVEPVKPKEPKEPKEPKDPKDPKDPRDPKDPKDPRDTRYLGGLPGYIPGYTGPEMLTTPYSQSAPLDWSQYMPQLTPLQSQRGLIANQGAYYQPWATGQQTPSALLNYTPPTTVGHVPPETPETVNVPTSEVVNPEGGKTYGPGGKYNNYQDWYMAPENPFGHYWAMSNAGSTDYWQNPANSNLWEYDPNNPNSTKLALQSPIAIGASPNVTQIYGDSLLDTSPTPGWQ